MAQATGIGNLLPTRPAPPAGSCDDKKEEEEEEEEEERIQENAGTSKETTAKQK